MVIIYYYYLVARMLPRFYNWKNKACLMSEFAITHGSYVIHSHIEMLINIHKQKKGP